jgi:hypothetical protein
MAAALVRSTEGDGDENWILAEVVSYNLTTGKYEVWPEDLNCLFALLCFLKSGFRLWLRFLVKDNHAC